MTALFTEFSLKDVTLRNRIAVHRCANTVPKMG